MSVIYSEIKKFMELAGQDCPAKPVIPGVEVRRLRAKLILEEALETINALGFSVEDGEIQDPSQEQVIDLQAVADGCADLDVVTKGCLIACGIQDDILMREVCKSNLSKFRRPTCECGETMVEAKTVTGDLKHWYCSKCEKTKPKEAGPWKRPDGKLMKGATWQPPQLDKVVAWEARADQFWDFMRLEFERVGLPIALGKSLLKIGTDTAKELRVIFNIAWPEIDSFLAVEMMHTMMLKSMQMTKDIVKEES